MPVALVIAFQSIVALIGKTLITMVMQVVTGPFIEEMIVWGLKKAAPMTKTNIDDELVAMVVKQLEEKK